MLRLDDLVGRFALDVDRGGFAGDFFTDFDKIAAQRQIIDRLRIVADVEDRHCGAREPCEVGRTADLCNAFVRFEKRLESHGRREGVFLDAPRCDFVNARVERIIEMMRFDDRGDAVEDVVVHQERAKERLFGFDVMGRRLNFRRSRSIGHFTLPRSMARIGVVDARRNRAALSSASHPQKSVNTMMRNKKYCESFVRGL